LKKRNKAQQKEVEWLEMPANDEMGAGTRLSLQMEIVICEALHNAPSPVMIKCTEVRVSSLIRNDHVENKD
jgi:hypothetical protein